MNEIFIRFSTVIASTLVILSTTSSAERVWVSHKDGKAKSSSLCEFEGEDISGKVATLDECIAACTDDARCTHFVIRSSECLLKAINESPQESESDNAAFCGFIVKQPAQVNSDDTSSVSDDDSATTEESANVSPPLPTSNQVQLFTTTAAAEPTKTKTSEKISTPSIPVHSSTTSPTSPNNVTSSTSFLSGSTTNKHSVGLHTGNNTVDLLGAKIGSSVIPSSTSTATASTIILSTVIGPKLKTTRRRRTYSGIIDLGESTASEIPSTTTTSASTIIPSTLIDLKIRTSKRRRGQIGKVELGELITTPELTLPTMTTPKIELATSDGKIKTTKRRRTHTGITADSGIADMLDVTSTTSTTASTLESSISDGKIKTTKRRRAHTGKVDLKEIIMFEIPTSTATTSTVDRSTMMDSRRKTTKHRRTHKVKVELGEMNSSSALDILPSTIMTTSTSIEPSTSDVTQPKTIKHRRVHITAKKVELEDIATTSMPSPSTTPSTIEPSNNNNLKGKSTKAPRRGRIGKVINLIGENETVADEDISFTSTSTTSTTEPSTSNMINKRKETTIKTSKRRRVNTTVSSDDDARTSSLILPSIITPISTGESSVATISSVSSTVKSTGLRIGSDSRPSMQSMEVSTAASLPDNSRMSSAMTISDSSFVWNDEFDFLDLKKWKQTASASSIDNSFQYFSGNPENSFAKNGILYIKPTLTEDRFGQDFLRQGTLDLVKDGCDSKIDGKCIVQGDPWDIVHPVASAQIVSKSVFNLTEIKSIEVRAKMPKGDWIVAGISLKTFGVGKEVHRTEEMKICSVRGNAQFNCLGQPFGRQMATTGFFINNVMDDRHDDPSVTFSKVNRTVDFSTDFHIYRMDRTNEGLQFFIDGEEIGTIKFPLVNSNEHVQLGMNVKVGGKAFPTHGCDYSSMKQSLYPHSHGKRNFWEMKKNWLPTWNVTNNDNALQVDYIHINHVKPNPL